MVIERIPSSAGSYSEAVVSSGPGRWVHVSGMLGLDGEGELISGGVYAEATACFAAIDKALAAAAASFADVVKINAFLTDLDSYGEFSRARAEAFPIDPPASAAVEVSALLLGASVEVEAVAFVSTGRAGG